MYYAGLGVPQDDAKAAHWFKKGAEQGNAIAQSNLAVMYYKGSGVPQNYAQAFYWYRKAAEQGDALSQSNLARITTSVQVFLGITQAFYWYRMAAEQGYASAPKNLGVLFEEGERCPPR